MRLENSPLLDAAESLLMMPDLFHWLLTGVKANEMTDATTTQFFDPQRGDWARGLHLLLRSRRRSNRRLQRTIFRIGETLHRDERGPRAHRSASGEP